MARPHKYTPESFAKAVNKYLEDCKAADTFPSEPGMLLALDISEDTLSRYKEQNGYADTIKKALAVREEYLQRIVLSNGAKSVTGAIFLLKQPKNGGYQDKQIADGNINVNIGFKNLDKKAFD